MFIGTPCILMCRAEQEQASRLEEERKGMETKLRNLQIQVDEGESEALRSVVRNLSITL